MLKSETSSRLGLQKERCLSEISIQIAVDIITRKSISDLAGNRKPIHRQNLRLFLITGLVISKPGFFKPNLNFLQNDLSL